MCRGAKALVLSILIPLIACTEQQAEPQQSNLRIYLARHGETDWNVQRRLQGGTDTELNDTGRSQARELARRLAGIQLDAIYSSQLQRSKKTAASVAGDRPFESLAELNEQSLGKFEGVYLDGRDPELELEFDHRYADPDDTLDGGESVNQHLARVERALELIRSRHPSGQVLVVGHGGTNDQILRSLLDLTAGQAGEIHQDNSELYLIELAPQGEPRLWKYISPGNLHEL